MDNAVNIAMLFQTIKRGDKSPFVQYLSLALRRAGFLDGIYRTLECEVEDALKKYQQSTGITADGVAGDDVWNNLIKYILGYEIVPYTNNLTALADNYSTTVEAIQTANPNLKEGENIVVPFGYAVVPTDVDYTYALCMAIADGLTKRYPFVHNTVIGKSVMGKDIFSLHFGGGKRQIFINASHHANEWITTPVTIKFVEDFCRAYTENGTLFGESVKMLYDTRHIFTVPLVNPDGVDLVCGALNKQSDFYLNAVKISKNYPQIPFPDGWKANILGTDLNLNYPAGWERAREIKYANGFTTPAPRDYVGEAPLSAPESRSVYNYTLSNDFYLTVSYHTQGEVIYWRYLNYMPQNALEIGKMLSNASGYTLEVTPDQSGYAGYKDWFISYYNRPGYTVEAGFGENPLPISDFDKIYADNLPLIISAVKNIG